MGGKAYLWRGAFFGDRRWWGLLALGPVYGLWKWCRAVVGGVGTMFFLVGNNQEPELSWGVSVLGTELWGPHCPRAAALEPAMLLRKEHRLWPWLCPRSRAVSRRHFSDTPSSPLTAGEGRGGRAILQCLQSYSPSATGGSWLQATPSEHPSWSLSDSLSPALLTGRQTLPCGQPGGQLGRPSRQEDTQAVQW